VEKQKILPMLSARPRQSKFCIFFTKKRTILPKSNLNKKPIKVKLNSCADFGRLVFPVFRQILSIQSDFPDAAPDRSFICFLTKLQ